MSRFEPAQGKLIRFNIHIVDNMIHTYVIRAQMIYNHTQEPRWHKRSDTTTFVYVFSNNRKKVACKGYVNPTLTWNGWSDDTSLNIWIFGILRKYNN